MTDTLSDRSSPPVSPLRALWPVVAVVAGMTLLRIAFAVLLELRTDEAYYWTWSKEAVLSYLDHPPMIAWFIRAGTAIFGDTTLGVRFPGIAAMLATELLIADIVRRQTRDMRVVALAVLMMESALYYGLLMAKVAPDVALIPFAVAMMWALTRIADGGRPHWWLAVGVFAGGALLSKLTALLLLPAVIAFIVVPDWRRRWLLSGWPWLAAFVALAIFMPVLVWNAAHDWASFKFQFVRATANHAVSLRTFGDFVGLQFGQVGPVLLPVVLSGVIVTAWRGLRTREPVAVLLSTAVLAPFLYFLWKALTLRVGDTWPMFIWPAGFVAAAINIARFREARLSPWLLRSTVFWARAGIVSGFAVVMLVFVYYVVSPWNIIGRADPIGGEAGFAPVAARVKAQLDATGATWVATTDYRIYAMLRWHLGDRVPVIQINERARFIGFRDPGLAAMAGKTGIYVPRQPENTALLAGSGAVTAPLESVERRWRGLVMDTYVLKTIRGWTPDLSPPPASPLYKWPNLAGGPRATQFAAR